jgi:hypothetical protein
MKLVACPCGVPGIPEGMVCTLCAENARFRRSLADEANAELDAQAAADERDDQYLRDTDPSGCYDG